MTTSCSPTCNDGIREGSEECDTDGGDGCDTNCDIIEGWACDITNSEGLSTCTEICGDGLVVGSEGCDYGASTTDIDLIEGCANCQVKANFTCDTDPSNSPPHTASCTPGCPDGKRQGSEECDTNGADGCDANCDIIDGWCCEEDDNGLSTCNPICGDGLIIGD